MSNSEFNRKLIDMINEYMPVKSDQLDLLMAIIPLGREAAYRRLRGDVPFSFSEACIISQKLGKSLDQIASSVQPNSVMFQLRTLEPETVDDYFYYHNRLYEEHRDFIERFMDDTSVRIISACNMIPHTNLFPFRYLSKFRAFQWKYQMISGTHTSTLSDIEIPPYLEKKQKEMVDKVHKLPHNTLIFSRNAFEILIRQIEHFRNLNLISDDEIIALKQELYVLVSDMESLTMLGKTDSDYKIWVYLSNIDFESNYTYVSGENFEYAYLDLYQINSLITTNPIACKMHREWIESLRKYSTLISGSAEKDRIVYFNAQRKFIDELN